MWYSHAIGYFSAIKRNEIPMHTTTSKVLFKVKEARQKRPQVIWFHLNELFSINKSIQKGD